MSATITNLLNNFVNYFNPQLSITTQAQLLQQLQSSTFILQLLQKTFPELNIQFNTSNNVYNQQLLKQHLNSLIGKDVVDPSLQLYSILKLYVNKQLKEKVQTLHEFYNFKLNQYELELCFNIHQYKNSKNPMQLIQQDDQIKKDLFDFRIVCYLVSNTEDVDGVLRKYEQNEQIQFKLLYLIKLLKQKEIDIIIDIKLLTQYLCNSIQNKNEIEIIEHLIIWQHLLILKELHTDNKHDKFEMKLPQEQIVQVSQQNETLNNSQNNQNSNQEFQLTKMQHDSELQELDNFVNISQLFFSSQQMKLQNNIFTQFKKNITQPIKYRNVFADGSTVFRSKQYQAQTGSLINRDLIKLYNITNSGCDPDAQNQANNQSDMQIECVEEDIGQEIQKLNYAQLPNQINSNLIKPQRAPFINKQQNRLPIQQQQSNDSQDVLQQVINLEELNISNIPHVKNDDILTQQQIDDQMFNNLQQEINTKYQNNVQNLNLKENDEQFNLNNQIGQMQLNVNGTSSFSPEQLNVIANKLQVNKKKQKPQNYQLEARMIMFNNKKYNIKVQIQIINKFGVYVIKLFDLQNNQQFLEFNKDQINKYYIDEINHIVKFIFLQNKEIQIQCQEKQQFYHMAKFLND